MSLNISIHDTANNPPRAEAGKSGNTTWLSISQGGNEITIYGREDKADEIRMIADVFNDAFQPKPEEPLTPAPSASHDLDNDLPF